MTYALRFQGLLLPNIPWREFRKRYLRLEELGFDLVGTADHLVDWTNPPHPWFEQWTQLAAIASETTRIRLATLVTQIPLRNPAMLARQALTVDHISDGRLELGLGTGLEIDPSYGMMGVPNWRTQERVARFEEYVGLVDQLLCNEVTTYKGRFYEVNDMVLNPRPVQHPRPPIMVAALGPVMIRHAARYADIWNSVSFAEVFDAQMEETHGRSRRIDEQCAAIGRDPASLRRSYLMFDAKARSSGGTINYYTSESIFADMAQRLIDLGITDIGLYYPALDEQLPVFENIARRIIPELKAKHDANG
jgi:alkanesulfonate monooxygenase SsuD/methylene tetrahydromethanopterin reductase-like flavin-dependent oxidoreductase (luciferase family)